MKLNCTICSTLFYRSSSRIKNKTHLFCSVKCRGKGHSIFSKNVKLTKICAICSQVFDRIPSRIKNTKHLFCSTKCQGKGHSKFNKTKIIKVCEICTITFKVSPCRKHAKYCGWSCEIKARKLYEYKRFAKGEKHPNYKHGLSDFRCLLSTTKQYQIWRRAVFVRDNYTCQKCFNKKVIVAHHKISFGKLIKKAIEKNPLLDKVIACYIYDLLWDINNGITLCRFCHPKEHRRFV